MAAAKHTTTITPTTTPAGTAGYRITCDCTTHRTGQRSAIVEYDIAAKNVHGTVLLANSPSTGLRTALAGKPIGQRMWAA